MMIMGSIKAHTQKKRKKIKAHTHTHTRHTHTKKTHKKKKKLAMCAPKSRGWKYRMYNLIEGH